jgi:tetratricopeptide (TPR) repeat protein
MKRWRGIAGFLAARNAGSASACGERLHELKRDAEAFTDLRKLQADSSVDPDARRDAYLLNRPAPGRRRSEGEMDAFARGLAAYPDDGALLYARFAELGTSRRHRPRRGRSAQGARRRTGTTSPRSNALGYTLADRTTRYAEALQLIDRARVAEPDNPAIIDSYGWVLYRLGRTREALVELRRAFHPAEGSGNRRASGGSAW